MVTRNAAAATIEFPATEAPAAEAQPELIKAPKAPPVTVARVEAMALKADGNTIVSSADYFATLKPGVSLQSVAVDAMKALTFDDSVASVTVKFEWIQATHIRK